MARRGGQPGNSNASRGKMWRAAIERALERRSKSRADGIKEIDALAEKLLDLVAAGDLSALREFGDRIDGKPHQSMDVGHYEVPVEEMEDSELERIAAGGRKRASETQKGEKKPTRVH